MGIFNWFKKTDDSKIKMSENLSDDEKIVITIDQVKVSSTKTKWGEIVDFCYGDWEIDEDDYEIFTRDDEMNDELLEKLDPNGEFITVCKSVLFGEGLSKVTTIYEVSFINCDCPEELVKYFSDGFLITDDSGQFVKSDSDYFKKIISGINDGSIEMEIGSNGYECYHKFNFQPLSYFKFELQK